MICVSQGYVGKKKRRRWRLHRRQAHSLPLLELMILRVELQMEWWHRHWW
jgi:hypothetical protein